MAEWIRVDDADGERWHKLARTRADGRLLARCGLVTAVENTMDRRKTPARSPCPDCQAAATTPTATPTTRARAGSATS